MEIDKLQIERDTPFINSLNPNSVVGQKFLPKHIRDESRSNQPLNNPPTGEITSVIDQVERKESASDIHNLVESELNAPLLYLKTNSNPTYKEKSDYMANKSVSDAPQFMDSESSSSKQTTITSEVPVNKVKRHDCSQILRGLCPNSHAIRPEDSLRESSRAIAEDFLRKSSRTMFDGTLSSRGRAISGADSNNIKISFHGR